MKNTHATHEIVVCGTFNEPPIIITKEVSIFQTKSSSLEVANSNRPGKKIIKGNSNMGGLLRQQKCLS